VPGQSQLSSQLLLGTEPTKNRRKMRAATVLSSFVLLGDFNIDFCNQKHPLFCKLSIFLNSFVITQVVPHPTHINPSGNSTLIDLVLLSAPSQLVRCEVIPPLGNSDHNGINLSVKCFRNPPLT